MHNTGNGHDQRNCANDLHCDVFVVRGSRFDASLGWVVRRVRVVHGCRGIYGMTRHRIVKAADFAEQFEEIGDE